MAACMRDELDRIGLAVERARRDLVEQRLPHMRPGAINQRDRRFVRLPKTPPKPGCKFQTRSAAADDEDAVERGVARRSRLHDAFVDRTLCRDVTRFRYVRVF